MALESCHAGKRYDGRYNIEHGEAKTCKSECIAVRVRASGENENENEKVPTQK